MILDWLKRIFNIKSKEPIPHNSGEGGDLIQRFEKEENKISKLFDDVPKELTSSKTDVNEDIELKELLNQLDQKKRVANEEKKQIILSSTEWYNISISKAEERKYRGIFHGYRFGEILNLKALKEERLKKEARELKAFEDKIKSQLNDVEKEIGQRHADEAMKILATISKNLAKVKDITIRQKYKRLQTSFSNLSTELEREKLTRLAEEKRRKEEENRKQKEAEEQRRKAQEVEEQAKRKKREADAQRLVNEAKKKEQAEQQERQRLLQLSSKLKDEWRSIIQVLEENGIKYLYHFTDRSNIPLIKRYGGLLSWAYCEKHGIRIPKPGGGQLSRNLDLDRNLQDYVRLSFVKEHPMKYVARDDGRISDPVNLLIDIKAACIANVLYSNKNATIKREPVNIGSTIDDLKQIHFESVKVHRHFDLDEDERSYFQAEVMIKTFLPKEYIVNLDNY